MRRLSQIVEQSFSLRMSLAVLIVAASVFFVVFGAYFQKARESVYDDAVEQAYAKLDNTVLRIEKALVSVETAVNNISWLVDDNLHSPKYMYELTRQLLQGNPYIVGSAIAFEPGYYPTEGEFFSPYSYRHGDEICNKQLGAETYDYPTMEWYQMPRTTGKPYWSEPYFDEGGSDLLLTTYSMPLMDAEGRVYAVFTADISLERFAQKVSAIRLYPHSQNFMIGREGNFLVHNRKEAILNESFLTTPLVEANKALTGAGRRMLNGERGMTGFSLAGEDYYLFYAPVRTTGWSISVICLYGEVFARIDGLRNSVLLIFVFGLLVLLAVCYFTIRRMTKPLELFAASANEIAKGNFLAPLPETTSKDEMRTLRDSFQYMQRSLLEYIEELKETTARNERIESELRIARDIQMGMLPKDFPYFTERHDIDIHALLIPAREVGGDLYDFFLRVEKLFFVVGDVSGKGVPASLLMAVVCRLFRTVSQQTDSPSEIVAMLNNALAQSNPSNMFCTFFIGVLDLTDGHLQYCNAGHNAPLVVTPQGEVEGVQVETNLPLGLFEGVQYIGQECHLPDGSTLVLYTDGITEAENQDRLPYTEERMHRHLQTCNNASPRQMAESLLDDVRKWSAGGVEQSDDITVVCIGFNGER